MLRGHADETSAGLAWGASLVVSPSETDSAGDAVVRDDTISVVAGLQDGR